MTEGRRQRTALQRLATLDSLSDPIKCLLVSSITLPFMVGWVARLTAIQRDPTTARYVSRAFLPTMLAYQWAQAIGHALIIVLALALHKLGKRQAPWLVHLEIQWWFACFSFSFYALGPFTSPFGVLLLVLPVAGSLIFPPRAMFYGLVMLGIYSALMIGLERLGQIPYAPFLAYPPFEDGRLVGSWVASIGAPAIFASVVVLTLYSWIVVQWRRRERELELMIGTDPLTGVSNRRVFFERLREEMTRQARHGGAVSVLMVDVDHFKDVNDRYGHQAGDQVLVSIANALRASLRTTDIVSRYGGEEFALILPETDAEAAQLAAERVRAAVREFEYATLKSAARVTISVGIATMRAEEELDQLVSRADQALYRAKEAGRDRVEFAH